ncbi:hypothetical protein [Flavobacterium sp. SM2513]|uniref:hypothetical protein n=1 Tax=Flavobacterium sp. SM2513 TaxID=3424766 RepID=UPI003D7F9A91
MKKAFLLVFSFFTLFSFGQNINQYEFLIVPTQFNFQDSENEHRLNTLVKFRLEEYGFKAFYTAENRFISYEDRCNYLNVNAVSEGGMFVTKLYIEFKDCQNLVVFKSAIGKSRNKDRKAAYIEAMEEALLSIKDLNYKFEGMKTEKIVEETEIENASPIAKKEVVNENALFAQSITNGFQLVDKTPKVILKIYKTSEVNYYIAISGEKNGIVFMKNSEWYFEYYLNEKLVSEKLSIKF